MSSILSRVSVINIPVIPELNQIAIFAIDDAYRIVNIKNVESLDSYRTNNHQEGNNHRINFRITPSISRNLWTFVKAMMKEQSNDERIALTILHVIKEKYTCKLP
jgi:hypothetical protein